MLPAHSLLNEVCHQAESQVLRYITPSKCPSRETEILNLKLEKELSIEHNTLKIKDKDQAIPVDTGSEFLIYQALVRRCVAYAFANLIAFDIQHKWITFLFKLLSKDVPQGYSRVTLGQILAADKAAYVYIAEHCTDLKPDPTKMPLNEVMQAMPTNFEVMLFAQPLPRAPAKILKEASEPKGSRPGPYQPVKASAKGGGKGRGRGKSDFRSKGSGPMPKELVGNPSKDSQGRNICFAYNLPGGCPDAKDGESCSATNAHLHQEGLQQGPQFAASQGSLTQPGSGQAQFHRSENFRAVCVTNLLRHRRYHLPAEAYWAAKQLWNRPATDQGLSEPCHCP